MSEPCHQCFSCCRYLVLFVTQEDVLREPKLLTHYQEDGRIMPFLDEKKVWRYQCPMLAGWGCTIYATRPQACRDFARGSPKCEIQRQHEGKEPVDD